MSTVKQLVRSTRQDSKTICANGNKLLGRPKVKSLSAITKGIRSAERNLHIAEKFVNIMTALNDQNIEQVRSYRYSPSRPSTSEEWIVATHEAGHVVMGRLLGRSVQLVHINQNDKDSGAVHFFDAEIPGQNDPNYRKFWEDEIMISLAGAVAETILVDHYDRESCRRDFYDVRKSLNKISKDTRERADIKSRLWYETEDLLRLNWHLVEGIETALRAKPIRRQTLYSMKVIEICKELGIIYPKISNMTAPLDPALIDDPADVTKELIAA